MKLNIVLPWILVLGLGAALASVYVSNTSKNTELEKLRDASQQTEQLRAELDQVKTQSKSQEDQIASLRNDQQELLRLRGEVSRMRDERQQLSKQLQAAQSQTQAAQAQAAQTARSGAETMQRLQAENQQLRSGATQAQQQASLINACINNLRQLDGAKQQWALENGKTAEAVPTPNDVARYLAGNKLPSCPGGGTYSLNSVKDPPTCSIPGHALSN